MTTAKENLHKAFETLIDESSYEALVEITGIFVSYTVAYMEANDLPVGAEIQIDGGINRNITIHAAKPMGIA